MSIRIGAALTLLAQSRPRFERALGGGFDSGERKFKCLSNNVDALMGSHLAVGTSDAAIMRTVAGSGFPTSPRRYRFMLVANAGIEHEEGGVAILRVEYQGVMLPKSGSIQFNTTSQEQTVMPILDGYTVLAPVRQYSPVPTIEHVWTSYRGRPSAIAPGTAIRPPGITDNEILAQANYLDSFAPATQLLFRGWLLLTRVMRSPGNAIKSAVWEVTDLYQYVETRTQATAT